MASIVNTLSEYARLKRLQYSGLETTGTITPSTPEEYITIGIQPYNDNLYAIANLTGTTGYLKKTAQGTWVLDTNTYLTGITSQQIITALGYTPVTNARTLTINGVTYDLTADRSWTIAAGVTSFNTRTGAITLSSSDVTTALGFTPENATNKGVANGYASLDGSGLVPSTQLPSYVDDVLEYTNLAAFPATGTTGKIYVDLATNKIYRWSGSTYIEVSPTVGVVWGSITGTLANQTDLQSALSSKQPLDADLTAIASLSGTTGFLVKTAADTWTLDTNVYLTSSALTSYVPYTGATTALNLGNNNFRANRIYGSTAITIDNASSAGLVNFYTYTFGSNTYAGGGYVAIGSSLDNGLSIYYTNASVTRIAHLNGASLTGNRTYTLPDATGTFALTSDLSSYVPTTRSITINGTTYDLSANRSWTINSMVYPGAGIAVSTGTAWGTSITDNSTNWNTAYSWGNHASAGYLTTSSASATYLTISNAASTYLTASGAASTYQPLDGDLTSIAGLAGTSGLLKKTAANTWTLDTTAYGTGSVTSVALSVPTGLTVSGSPITTSGTLAITLTAGYSIPTTASQTNWDSAYTDRLKWDGGSTGLVAATGRTSLGATTVGSNLFTLTNPSAITFLRINADNTVSTLDAATFRTAIGAGTSSTTGTVTSVAMTTPTGLTVSGSPITSSGTLALTFTAGYSIPTTASQTNWDTAYGWGNHASAGYLTSATAATTYVPVTRTLTINGTAYDLSANRSWTISAGSTALSGLSDVTITSVANGQLLQYSTASSKWVNWTPNYLTSYTETDTLATVTARGSSTTGAITVSGKLTATGGATYAVIGTSSQRYIYQALNTANTVNATYGWWWFHNTNGDMGFHADAVGDVFTLTRAGAATFSSSVTAGGIISAPAASGFANSTYTSGRNPIWRFGNADAYGLSYFQGTGGYTSGVDMIGLHFGTASVAGSQFSFVQDGRFIATGAITASSFVKSGGTSSQFLKADGSVDSTGYTTNTGTVTSVSGTGTVSGLTLTGTVTTSGSLTLGGTLSLTSGNVTTALGYTPYNSTNPNGYTSNTGTVTSVSGTGSYGGLTLSGTVTTSGSLTLGGTPSGTWPISISGNAATATSSPLLSTLANYVWSASTTPTSFNQGIQSSFVSSSQGFQSYGSVMTMNTYSGGGGALQLYVPYSPTYGGSAIQVRFGNYDVSSGNSWTAWKTLLQSDNYTSYSPSLTGSGASGTWGISISGSSTSCSGNSATATTATNWGTYGGVPAAGTSFGNANTIGRSDANGYTFFNYINSNTSNSENPAVSQVIVTNGGDNYYRKSSISSFTGYVQSNASGTWGISVSGNAATATRTSGVSGYGHAGTGMYAFYNWGGSNGGASAPTDSTYTVGISVGSNPGDQAYGFQIGRNMWNTGLWVRGYDSGWGTWYRILDTANYNSYSPTLTGGGASGSWGISVTGSAGSVAWTNVSGRPTAVSSFTNDSGYYSYNSNPTFNETYTNSWFRNNTNNTGLYNQNTTQHLSSTSNGYWDMSSTTTVSAIRFYTGGHMSALRGYVYANTSNEIGFLNSSGSWSLRMDNSGNAYITGTITESSSVRYKENIADLSYSLEDALKLRPVEYTKIGTSHREVGFIAEEVNDIIPEAVMKNEDGSVESISYGRLTAVLLKAVKEQQQQINELKELLNTK